MDESAGLENRSTGNCTVGSNPTLSATSLSVLERPCTNRISTIAKYDKLPPRAERRASALKTGFFAPLRMTGSSGDFAIVLRTAKAIAF